MQLLIESDDFKQLKPSTVADIVATLLSKVEQSPSFKKEDGWDWVGVVDLSSSQADEFMEGCKPETIAGLRVVAEEGPVIHASQLGKAGITNYGHWQGRVTQRTRTITRDRAAYLLGYDNWKAQGGVGHFAVTPATFQALRNHFRLD